MMQTAKNDEALRKRQTSGLPNTIV